MLRLGDGWLSPGSKCDETSTFVCELRVVLAVDEAVPDVEGLSVLSTIARCDILGGAKFVPPGRTKVRS